MSGMRAFRLVYTIRSLLDGLRRALPTGTAGLGHAPEWLRMAFTAPTLVR